MRLTYSQIAKQPSVRAAAKQYLSDWYSPAVPHLYKDVVLQLVWCVQNNTSESQFKYEIKQMYGL